MIEQTVNEFAADMDRLSNEFGRDFTPALQECRPVIQEDIQAHFDQTLAWSGSAWPPHAPSTIKRYGPHRLLVLSGQLMAAAVGEGFGHLFLIPDGTKLIYGVDGGHIPYAAVQQWGGGNNIPAREYMWLSDEAIDGCSEIIADHAVKMMG